MSSAKSAMAAVTVIAIAACLLFSWIHYGPSDDDEGIDDTSGDWLRSYTYQPSHPVEQLRFMDLLSLEVSGDVISFTTSSIESGSWSSSAVIVSDREAIPVNDHNMQMYFEDGTLYCIEIHSGGPDDISELCYSAYIRGGSATIDSDDSCSGARFSGKVTSVGDDDLPHVSEGTVFIESVHMHMASIIVTVELGALELKGFVKTFDDRTVITCVSVDRYADYTASVVMEDGDCLISSMGDASWSFVSDGASMPLELSPEFTIVYPGIPDLTQHLSVVGKDGAYWTTLFGYDTGVEFFWTSDSVMLLCHIPLGYALYIDTGDGRTFRTLGDSE